MSKVKSYEDYINIGKASKTTTTTVADVSYNNDYKEFNFWDWKKKGYRVFTRTAFQKRFTAKDRDIMDVLESDADIGKMHRLTRHIDNENMIMYSNNEKKEAIPANKELMLKIIGGSEKRAREFLRKTINLGIIHELKIPNDGKPDFRYFVSPVYTMTSAGLTLHLYRLFREQLFRYLRPQAIIDLEKLIYYELHPEELVALKEKDVEDFSQSLLACWSNGEDNASELRNRISIWLSSYPELSVSIALKDLSFAQLNLIEKSFCEYASHNDIEQLIQNTDGLLMPKDCAWNYPT